MKRLLFAVGGLFLFLMATGQSRDSLFIRALADEILTHGKAYDNLRDLTKKVGGRLNGSAQTYQAVAWAQQALRQAGADTVYLQACRIPHWMRGSAAQVQLIGKGRRSSLQALALGNSVGTPKAGIQAPVLLIHDFSELEKRKTEVKGKIVFYNYPFNDKLISTFMAYGDAVRYRAIGASLAAKYGAVAVLIRSMTHATNNYPHTGAMEYLDSMPRIPALAIGIQDADQLAERLMKEPLQLWVKTGAYRLPDTVGYNVVGEWRSPNGSGPYLLVGGHLDSWDPAEGAQDDGAGCVQSIEVLRALKGLGYRPNHPLRVVLFTDEENSGSGAAKYAEIARSKNESHLLALESDAGGFTPRAFSLSMSADQLTKFGPWISQLKPYGVYEFLPGSGGADVEPLKQGLAAVVGELFPDPQRYFDYHHSAADVFENVNKRELELGAINMAALIYLVDQYGW